VPAESEPADGPDLEFFWEKFRLGS
jgi:hypothetical protein